MRLALTALLAFAATTTAQPRPAPPLSLADIGLRWGMYADGRPVAGTGHIDTEVMERGGVAFVRATADGRPVPFVHFAVSRDLADELRRAEPRGVPWAVRLTVAAFPSDHPVRRVAGGPAFEVRQIEVLAANGAVARTLTPAEAVTVPPGTFTPPRGPIRPDPPRPEPARPPVWPPPADRPADPPDEGRGRGILIALVVVVAGTGVGLLVGAAVMLARKPTSRRRDYDEWDEPEERRPRRAPRRDGRFRGRLPYRCPNCRFQTMLTQAEADARMICPECHAVSLLPGRVKDAGMSAAAVRGFVGAAAGCGLGTVLLVAGMASQPLGMGLVYLGGVFLSLGAASLGMGLGSVFRR